MEDKRPFSTKAQIQMAAKMEDVIFKLLIVQL